MKVGAKPKKDAPKKNPVSHPGASKRFGNIDKHVVILQPERLTDLAGFNPNYLHLGGGEEDKPQPRRAAR